MSLDDYPDSVSSQSDSVYVSSMAGTSSPVVHSTLESNTYEQSNVSHSPSTQSRDGLRKVVLRSRSRVSRTQAVIVVGPPGQVSFFVIHCIQVERFLGLERVRWYL